MNYLNADTKHPYMGLDNKVWLSEEDVKRKKCKNKPTFDMIGVHRCGCLERRKN